MDWFVGPEKCSFKVTNNNWVQPIVDGMDYFLMLEEVFCFFFLFCE
jgi:hypothetical protein